MRATTWVGLDNMVIPSGQLHDLQVVPMRAIHRAVTTLFYAQIFERVPEDLELIGTYGAAESDVCSKDLAHKTPVPIPSV
jgi:hypothetical protein